MIPAKLQVLVIIVVSVVWVANFAAGLIPALDYEPQESINGIFAGIVGTAIALGAKRNGGGDD